MARDIAVAGELTSGLHSRVRVNRSGLREHRPLNPGARVHRSFLRSVRTAVLGCLALCVTASSAYAYRPFDITDASVAERGEMEIECGPFGYIVDAEGRFLVAPSAILNFGLADRWELVIEGRHFFRLKNDASRRYTLRDAALSVKHVLRSGSLQDRSGPSVGLEVGMRLPAVGVGSGVGASFAGLMSHRWSAVTMHVNGSLEITHDHRLAGLAGAIVEGPSRWTIRPVAELTLEQDEDRTVSGLVGAIWKVRDNLSLDAGWRMARTADDNQREFRAGFTWTISLSRGANSQPAVGSWRPLGLAI